MRAGFPVDNARTRTCDRAMRRSLLLPLLLAASCTPQEIRDRAATSPAEITPPTGEPEEPAIVTASPAPVLEYRFETDSLVVENTGSWAGADGVRWNHGYPAFGPASSTDVPPGAGSLRSAFFDGIDDQVHVPDDVDMTSDGTGDGAPLTTLTIEAWVRPLSLDGPRVIWDDFGQPGSCFHLWDGVVQFGMSTTEIGTPGISVWTGNVGLDEWHHIAGVWDGAELRVYLDGVDTCDRVALGGSFIDNSWVNPGHAPLSIGADGVTIPAWNFHGWIDEVRVFDVALAQDQIAGGLFAGVTSNCGGEEPPPTPTPTPCDRPGNGNGYGHTSGHSNGKGHENGNGHGHDCD